MPIADLLELVVQLKGRIESHGPALRQNEALTRYALIDPLLRALGWDTEDPAVVIPEYAAGKGKKADYALLQMPSETTTDNPHPAKAAVIVEAKSLDTPLGDEVVQQGIRYKRRARNRILRGDRWQALDDLRAPPTGPHRRENRSVVRPEGGFYGRGVSESVGVVAAGCGGKRSYASIVRSCNSYWRACRGSTFDGTSSRATGAS